MATAKIDVDATLVGSASAPAAGSSSSPPALAVQKKRSVLLSSEDKLYEDLRDTNFAIVGNLLNKIARRLNNDYEGRHQAKTVSEIKQFVSKLGGLQQEHQSLRLHTGLAEEIMKHTRSDIFNKVLELGQSRHCNQCLRHMLTTTDLIAGIDPSSQHEAIEELMARGAPILSVLRLLCIESVVSGGIKPKVLESFKREVLHAYGYHHLITLNALDKMQLLQSRNAVTASSSKGTSYPNLQKPLRLIVDEVNEHEPDDVSYVYSGYAPLSVRLVQCIVQKPLMAAFTKGRRQDDGAAAAGGVSAGASGWRGFEDVLKNVGGKTFDEVQRGEEKAVRARNILDGQQEKKVTLVFFLGGCTFTEIAALRFVGRQEEGACNPTPLRDER